jgi:hypothetical protein
MTNRAKARAPWTEGLYRRVLRQSLRRLNITPNSELQKRLVYTDVYPA